jgi:Transposase
MQSEGVMQSEGTATEPKQWRSGTGPAGKRNPCAGRYGGYWVFALVRATLGGTRFELWIGDPAEIKTRRVKKQKTGRKDAQLLLRLMQEDNFPKIWVPSPENRDLRQLLWHRHRLVQMRTRIMNQLQALAMNEGKRRKTKLCSEQGRAELEKLA